MSKKKPTKKKPSKSRITLAQAMKLSEPEQRRLIEELKQDSNYLWVAEFLKNEKLLRAQLSGDGDDTIERSCIELHEETGLDFNELLDLPAREFRRVLSAAIRKRDSRNWITVPREHLRGVDSTLSRAAEKGNEIRRIRSGRYQVRIQFLSVWIEEKYLELYLRFLR
jgi:hypothetical protein